MNDIFKRTTNSIILSSIIAFIIGLIMTIYPDISIKTFGMVAAIYIILHGIILVVLDIKANEYYIPFDGMLSGILSIVLGIVLIAKPNILSTILVLAIGVWIVSSSINSIKMSIALKHEDAPWILLLLCGIVDLIIGIIVLLNPFEASLSITVFIGIMLIIHAVINIIDMIIIKRDVKRISKAIEKRLKEI